MITLLATIFAFGLCVMIHEFGHFIAAKAFRMKVEEFAIGFGPVILAKQGSETLYTLRLVPLGGFNKIAGMTMDENLDERSFVNQAVWKRFIVIAAGACMNFILAIFIFFAVLATTGIQTVSPEARIGALVPNGPAAQIHMQEGDRILTINGQEIKSWQEITPSLQDSGEKVINITYERNNEVIKEKILPQTIDGQVVIGIVPTVIKEDVSIVKALELSVVQTKNVIYRMTVGLYDMVFGETKAELSGPLGIAKMAGKVADLGFVPLIGFTALLSINLGVINLLPLPALDGGHLVILLIEGITRRRLPEKALYVIQVSGLGLIILLSLYATYSDFLRFF